MVTDKFAWELQRISMAGSKMFLCVVDWEGFIKVKIQNQKVPKKSESICEVMVFKENGNGRETVCGRESGQNTGGKKIWASSVFAQVQSCYLSYYIHT